MRQVHVTLALSATLLAACTEARALRPGDSFETELKAPDAHDYSLTLGTGESALVVVRQMGADLVVEIRDGEGRLIASVDSPNGRNGDEVVLLEPEVRGAYTLRVRPFGANEPAAKYEVRFPWLRDAQATEAALFDTRRWLAERHRPEVSRQGNREGMARRQRRT